MSLSLEINELAEDIQRQADGANLAGGRVLITPPVGESYWLARVKLTERQALLAFPKFMTLGIGFAHEEDWNTNLPYQSGTMVIYNHIKHNRLDATKSDCLDAIVMLQAECHRVRGTVGKLELDAKTGKTLYADTL